MELPLLHEIEQMGGSARPKDVYDRVARHFPDLTEEDRKVQTKTGANLLTNRVQFTRNSLVKKGALDSGEYGVWKITQSGRERLAREWPSGFKPEYAEISRKVGRAQPKRVSPRPGPEALPRRAVTLSAPEPPSAIREHVLERVRALDDAQFERLCGRMMEALGARTSPSPGGAMTGEWMDTPC